MEKLLKYRPLLLLCSVILLSMLVIFWIGLVSDVYFSIYGTILSIIDTKKINLSGWNVFADVVKIIGAIVFSGVILNIFNFIDALYTSFLYERVFKEFPLKKYRLSQILLRAYNWAYFKTGYIFGPHFIILGCFTLLFGSAFIFFNQFAEIAGYSIGFAAFVTVFAILILSFMFLASSVLSTWRHLITFYGYETVISEPSMSNVNIIRRSEKLFFSSPVNCILYLISLLYSVAVVYQLFRYITIPEFVSLENISMIFLCVALNLAFLAVFKYVRLGMYIKSIFNYYDKITFNRNKYLELFEKYYSDEDIIQEQHFMEQ